VKRMAARLLITDFAYVLSLIRGGVWVELSRLHGSAQALLAGVRALDEGQLEAAIQVAEDWVAPDASALQGEVLEVSDLTGRLLSGFAAVLASTELTWSIEALERSLSEILCVRHTMSQRNMNAEQDTQTQGRAGASIFPQPSAGP